MLLRESFTVLLRYAHTIKTGRARCVKHGILGEDNTFGGDGTGMRRMSSEDHTHFDRNDKIVIGDGSDCENNGEVRGKKKHEHCLFQFHKASK